MPVKQHGVLVYKAKTDLDSSASSTPFPQLRRNVQHLIRVHRESNTQLGEALGVDRTNVWRWRRGRQDPHADLWPKLCKRWGVTMQQLLLEDLRATQVEG